MWFRKYWRILVVFLILSLSWIVYDLTHRKTAPIQEPLPAIIVGLAIHPDPPGRYLLSDVLVQGTASADKYGKDNYIMILCRVPDSSYDNPNAERTIDRSKRFGLAQGAVTVYTALELTQNRLLATGMLDIYLVMIPKAVQPSDIVTLKDVLSHGGRILDQKVMSVSTEQLFEQLNAPS